MSYRDESEKAVYKALNIAVHKHGRWVSAGEVRDVGWEYKIEAPQTPTRYNTGGWTVFDFTDRTKRFLDRLVKKKKAVYKKVGRRHYYNLK